jgi:hypothetical protein
MRRFRRSASSDDRVRLDRARPRRHHRIAARLLLQTEEGHEAAAGGTDRKVPERFGLEREALLPALDQAVGRRLQRQVRGRIVPLVHLRPQPLPRHARRQGDLRAPPRVEAAQQAVGDPPGGPARSLVRLLDDPLRGGQQQLGRHDVVDQARDPGSPRVERAAVQDDVERRRQPDETRQPLRAAPAGQDAEPHLGKTDLDARLIGRDAVMTCQRQLGAAAEAGAADRRHDRKRQRLERGEQPLPPARGLLGVLEGSQPADLVDVGPGDELLGPGARHDEAAEPLPGRLRDQDLQERDDRGAEQVDPAGRRVEHEVRDPFAARLQPDRSGERWRVEGEILLGRRGGHRLHPGIIHTGPLTSAPR